MKIVCGREADVLPIVLNQRRIQESKEPDWGVVFDYDRKGRFVALEILNASRRVK
ncbi:MAG: DUF2283 domain-containing protein [Planctomycetes bacterium]|nr:DUF2283 domain-containing protein [Planctomycetota bacterium]